MLPGIPNVLNITLPVPHTGLPATRLCQGMATDVAMIIIEYKMPAKMMASKINEKAFLGEKSNSSAACGILSKPKYAQGEIMMMVMMSTTRVDLFALKSGLMLLRSVAGWASIATVMITMDTIKIRQKINCKKAEDFAPRILKYAKRISAPFAISTSPRYTAQPLML